MLGAILIDPACITRVMEYIKPESFYRPQHQELFSVLTRMFVSSQTIDFITVLEMAKREGIFDTDEDAKIYLTQLAQIVPSTANVESYAKIVQEKSYIRSLILASQKVIDLSRDGSTDARTLLDMAEQSIFDIRQGRDASGLTRIDEIILQTYDRLQKLSGEDKEQYMGLPTGFAALDSIITGLNRTDLILVAARPGMGKTAFGLNIAANVATKDGQAGGGLLPGDGQGTAGDPPSFQRGADPVGEPSHRQPEAG